MTRKKRIFNNIFNAAIFIILEVAVVNMLTGQNGMQRFFLAKFAHSFTARVWGMTEEVKEFFNLKNRNKMLAEENFKLRSLLQSYLSDKADSLLHLPVSNNVFLKNNEYENIPGTIIKASFHTQHNYIILGQGYRDGVKPGSGIIVEDGVIGIIDAVSEHYAYAIPFMNKKFSLSARLGRSGAIGPMVWDGINPDGAILKEIPLQNKFSPGDTVFTSGYSTIFPPDIPVGTVGDSKIVNGATREIKIKLFRSMNNVRYVTIIYNSHKKEIEELENGIMQ